MFGNLSPFRKVKVTGRDGLLAKTWNALLESLRLLMPRTKMERWIVALSMLYFYSFYLGFFFFRNDALGYVMMGYDTMSNSFQFYFPLAFEASSSGYIFVALVFDQICNITFRQ